MKGSEFHRQADVERKALGFARHSTRRQDSKADAVPAALTSDPTHDGAVLHDVDGDVVVVHARCARVDAGEFVEGVAPVVVVGLVHTRAAAAVPAIVVCQ